jgi:ADP-ribose pyrophosphatase
MEFPAGLVDHGEDIETTAKRELLEETGFYGEIEKKSPELFSSPGIISEKIFYVFLSVDEKNPKNQMPVTKQEPGEFITVFPKLTKEIKGFFKEQANQGVLFDAKLYIFFWSQGIL